MIRHEINTNSDTQLSIQTCKTTITNIYGEKPEADEICISIVDPTIEYSEEMVTFLTKSEAIKFAIKILELVNEKKHIDNE